jgi:hypothetical protein
LFAATYSEAISFNVFVSYILICPSDCPVKNVSPSFACAIPYAFVPVIESMLVASFKKIALLVLMTTSPFFNGKYEIIDSSNHELNSGAATNVSVSCDSAVVKSVSAAFSTTRRFFKSNAFEIPPK